MRYTRYTNEYWASLPPVARLERLEAALAEVNDLWREAYGDEPCDVDAWMKLRRELGAIAAAAMAVGDPLGEELDIELENLDKHTMWFMTPGGAQ